MSGRGRRRRRRRPADPSGQRVRRETAGQSQGPKPEGGQQPARRRRRRGRRGREGQPSSPKSSEDLVRALPRERPETLTLPPDGTILEDVIGDLQSEWGVPQYPQEFRITLKVAEDRDTRTERAERAAPADAPVREAADSATAPAVEGGPKREKAPSLRGSNGEGGPTREPGTGRRRRRGRRRRGGGGEGGGESPGPSPS